MRIVLIGAVESTRIAIEILAKYGSPPAVLLTLPLSKSLRHSDYVHLEPLAVRYGIPAIEVANINQPEVLQQIRSFQPDYIFVIGWSQICREEFLSIPRIGSIGYHPALLPENRGRAVIPWTILQRQIETGSTLFWLDSGADSGDVLIQEKFSVDPDETVTTLYHKHCQSLERLLSQALPMLLAGNPPRIPQEHSRATYCAKRVPNDGLIDWNLPAESVWTLIRAVGKPYPGAFTFLKGKKLFIWEADYVGEGPYWGLPGQVQAVLETGTLVQCGDGKHVLLKLVQLENEPQLSANLLLKNHEKLGIDLLMFYAHLSDITSGSIGLV